MRSSQNAIAINRVRIIKYWRSQIASFVIVVVMMSINTNSVHDGIHSFSHLFLEVLQSHPHSKTDNL